MEKLKTQLPEGLYEKYTNSNLTLKKLFLLSDLEVQEQLHITPQDAALLFKAASSYIADKIRITSELSECLRLTTRCPNIDKILLGGIPAQGITEIYGPGGVGKTQFILNLCLSIQFPQNLGGFNRGALYITTESRFPSERFHRMCEATESQLQSGKNFEENLYVEQCIEFDQLKLCLEKRLPQLLAKIPIGLVVIDSIAAVFRSDNIDANFIDRSLEFHAIFAVLHRIIKQYNLVVICINQVTENLETNQCEPCLGLSWANLVAHRMEISRVSLESPIREIKVVNSYEMPEKSSKFLITSEGIEDYIESS